LAESIPPIPPVPPPPLPAASPPLPPVAEVPAPPPALAALPPGTRLDATVTARLAADSFQVATPAAAFVLRTPLPLAEGSRLSLLLPERPAIGFPVQLLTVDGRPAAALLAAAPAANPAVASVQPAVLRIGATVAATILNAPQTGGGVLAQTAPAAGTLPATAGTVLLPGAAAGRVTVAPAGLAGTLPPTSGSSSAAAAALPATTLAAAPATTPAARVAHDYARQSTLTAPEGERVVLRVVALRPPPPGGPAPAPPAASVPAVLVPGATVQGVVTGRLPQGFPVVQTPAGLLALTTLAEVEPGTAITLRVVAPAPAAPPAVHAGPAIDGEVAAMRDWPALRETLAALQATAPATARAMAEVLPRFDATLTASVLFLISSLRGGNLRDWLGEPTVRDMQRLRPELVARVSEDFGRLGVAADDPGAAWRGYLLPFLSGEALQPVRLFVHRHPEEDDKDPGTRFVVDVALSRLGRFQIDGLVNDKARRFDLILRTAAPLPPEMRADIREMFATALATTGQTGAIAFRADPSDFVEPQPGGPPPPDVLA